MSKIGTTRGRIAVLIAGAAAALSISAVGPVAVASAVPCKGVSCHDTNPKPPPKDLGDGGCQLCPPPSPGPGNFPTPKPPTPAPPPS